MDWLADYEAREWKAVENWWRGSDDLPALSALLTRLQRDVPKRTLSNGVDKHEEYLKARDAPDKWGGAAAILELGELEAKVLGDPFSDLEVWEDQHSNLRAELKVLAASPEDTKGDVELSRSAHAERALEALERVNKSIAFRVRLHKPEEREALHEFAADVAINALRAGYFAHAAESKAIQGDAVRGKVTLESAGAGGRSRARDTRHRTEMILKRMRELKDAKPRSILSAAEQAWKDSLGTSPNANVQLWKNHRKKW